MFNNMSRGQKMLSIVLKRRGNTDSFEVLAEPGSLEQNSIDQPNFENVTINANVSENLLEAQEEQLSVEETLIDEPIFENVANENDNNSHEVLSDDDENDPFETDDGGSDYCPSNSSFSSSYNANNVSSQHISNNDDHSIDISRQDPTLPGNNNDIISSHEVTNEEENSVPNSGEKVINPSESNPIVSRKRVRKEAEWIRNKRKVLRNSGQKYVNSKNKTVCERIMKPPCHEKCRLKCKFKIDEASRNHVFNEFWKLGDINRQRDYISKYVEVQQKKRVRVRPTTSGNEENLETRRNLSYYYYMPTLQTDQKIKVCQTFFINTLSISHQMVKTVVNKSYKVGITVVQEDKRGRTNLNSLLPSSVKNSVREHLNSIQRVESHYCRSNSQREYLPPELNITRLYEMYEENENIPRKASFSVYRQVFLNEFNLAFHIPKKDQCDLCNKFKNSNGRDKDNMEEIMANHIKAKELARKEKSKDKLRSESCPDFCVAAFDLQKALLSPKAEISQLYYRRKLSTYNLTVYDIGSRQGFCFMWHEAIALRGACEIGSCLFSFIATKVAEGKKSFSFYSDNCSGQNRNRYLFCLYQHCTAKFKVEIRHNFLQPGHTQNEGDSMHSVIERATKNVPIYCPDQWYSVARTACKSRPYIVKEMYATDIFDLKKMLGDTTKNWKKDEEGNIVKWSKIKVVQTFPETPNLIKFKYAFDSEIKVINTMEKKRGTLQNLDNYNLVQLRQNQIPIQPLKYKDLMHLCREKVIPEIYYPFYEHLKKGTISPDVLEVDNNDSD